MVTDVTKTRNVAIAERHTERHPEIFYYHMEQETLETQTREKISYMEAKRTTKERLLKLNISYAQISSVKPAPTQRPQTHQRKTAPIRVTEKPTPVQEPQAHQEKTAPIKET